VRGGQIATGDHADRRLEMKTHAWPIRPKASVGHVCRKRPVREIDRMPIDSPTPRFLWSEADSLRWEMIEREDSQVDCCLWANRYLSSLSLSRSCSRDSDLRRRTKRK